MCPRANQEARHNDKNPSRGLNSSLKIHSCLQRFDKTMDVLLNGLSISSEGELQSQSCMMGKTVSLQCHFLVANGWRLID